MTEELTGQSLVDNAEEAPQATPEAEPAPAPEPELPSRWAGKSAAEIARAHEELERKLGDQGRQLGAYKQQLESYDSELARIRNMGQPPQAQPQPRPLTEDSWYDSPLESTTRVAQEVFRKELGQFRQSMRYEEGTRAFPRTLAEVKRMEPEIFSDPEIENGVRQFVEYGVRNQGLDPMVQSDPTALIAIGNHLVYLKGKHRAAANPTMPVETENPAAVRKPGPMKKAYKFSDKEKSFINYLADRAPDIGIKSQEDAAKLLDEEENE